MGDLTPIDCPDPADSPSDAAKAALATAELLSLKGPEAMQLLCTARRQLTERIQSICMADLHRSAGITDGNEHHRATIRRHGGVTPFPASSSRQGIGLGASSPLCPEAPGIGRRIVDAARWLDDSWLGDFLGALSIFVTGYILFVAAGVLS